MNAKEIRNLAQEGPSKAGMSVKDLATLEGTKGYRVIVDGEHIVFKHRCKRLERIIASISEEPRIFKNMLGELVFDYRDACDKPD